MEATVTIEELASHDESVNWMLYGPAGHGKTAIAGHLPRSTFLSTEKGVVAAKRAGSKSALIRTPTWEHAVAGKKLADSKLVKGDWLIVDSVTKMQMLLLRWILRMEKARNPSRDLDIPAIQNHQKWQNYFKRFIDDLIDAPYNCLFIANHMRVTVEEMNDELQTEVIPLILGKPREGYEICNYIVAQMDVVSYYGITDKARGEHGETVRRMLFQPYPPFVCCKDRYDVFGQYQDIQDREYDAMAELAEMLAEAA